MKNRRMNFQTWVEVVTLSKWQLGTREIAARLGLSESQVSYRRSEGKAEEGLPKGVGYCQQWRLGQSPLMQRLFKMHSGETRRETRSKLREGK